MKYLSKIHFYTAGTLVLVAGFWFLNKNFSLGLNENQAASSVTISGRVYDRTCNIGFSGVTIETCNGSITTDRQGNFSFRRPIKTSFCVRVKSLERRGHSGPKLSSVAGSQNNSSYEWQNAGVNCQKNPSQCNVHQRREDRPLDSGYDFIYQNITGNCATPVPSSTPTSTPSPRSTTTPDTGLIDTLDYFLTDYPQQGLTGTHPLSYTIGTNVARYVKWAPNAFETYKWDNNYIYLAEDQSQPTDSGGPYSFANGLWMKRYMRVGESVANPNNRLTWLNPDCSAKSAQSFPYTNTLVAHNSTYNLGGDLGIQDVITLKYDYGGAYEKMYYAKQWGLVKWELYTKEGSLTLSSTFNQLGGAPIPPGHSCIR